MLDIDNRESVVNAYLENHKALLPFYGWAPGLYTCRSMVSGTRFLAAKGSVRTLPEAMAYALEHVASLEKISHEYADAKVRHRTEIDALNKTILSLSIENQRLRDIP